MGGSHAGEQELKMVAGPELKDANARGWCLLEKRAAGASPQRRTVC